MSAPVSSFEASVALPVQHGDTAGPGHPSESPAKYLEVNYERVAEVLDVFQAADVGIRYKRWGEAHNYHNDLLTAQARTTRVGDGLVLARTDGEAEPYEQLLDRLAKLALTVDSAKRGKWLGLPRRDVRKRLKNELALLRVEC